MKKPKICSACGSKSFVSGKNPPISLPWRDYPSVEVVNPLDLWVCGSCGELTFTASQAKKIDETIGASISLHVAKFIELIQEREGCGQREIASHLGVSPEYLSEIKSGRKIPKFQTFNFLKTLALGADSFFVASPSYKYNG